MIADHLRSTSFLLADGVLPSNEGRGYVLRRIMRRAMRHAHLLGAKEPLMHRLVPALVTEMGAAYPELGRAQPLIEEVLEREEITVPPHAGQRTETAGDEARGIEQRLSDYVETVNWGDNDPDAMRYPSHSRNLTACCPAKPPSGSMTPSASPMI